MAGMNLDDVLLRYFGTTNPSSASEAVQSAGVDHIRLDFAFERDGGKRFALWALMHMLGFAPDVDGAFESEDDRNAAMAFMTLLATGE